MSQRNKFALALNFLKPMNGLLRTGWKLYAHRQSPMNAAMSYTLANAITGNYPDYDIDPSKVLVSRGSLTPAANGSANAASSAITFDWDDNSGVNSSKQTDEALLAVVNPAKSEAVYDTEGATRADTTMSVNLPADWSGDEVHAYLGFISEDGREVANSAYLGAIEIA